MFLLERLFLALDSTADRFSFRIKDAELQAVPLVALVSLVFVQLQLAPWHISVSS